MDVLFFDRPPDERFDPLFERLFERVFVVVGTVPALVRWALR